MRKSVPIAVAVSSGIILLSSLPIYKYIFSSKNEADTSTKNEDQTTLTLLHNETSSCQTAQGLVFVKTHKTAGSSIKRVLSHYVQNRKLSSHDETVRGLPTPYYGGYPGKFKRRFASMVGSPLLIDYGSNKSERILKMRLLIGHFRFDKDEIQSIMRKDTKYVTIVRNPFRQFESSFYFYYGMYKDYASGRIKVACKGEPYYQITKKYGVSYPEYLSMLKHGISNETAWYFRSTNYQSYDLGLDPNNQTKEYVIEMATQLDSVFTLVMITDYYLESLVLLKEAICMEWSELLGRYRNKGQYEPHAHTKEEENIIRSLNKQDFLLYEYFNKTFWQKVEKYGKKRMQKDKEYLKKLMIQFENDRMAARNKTKRVSRSIPQKKSQSIAISGNENYVTVLMKRIQERTSEQLDPRVVNEMANYMYDNAGWCPQ